MARSRVRTPTGDWLTVRAIRDLATPNGQSTTLDLEPSGDLLPLLARAYRLTPREEQIVQLVLSVFDKTSVRSRRELAYRFALAHW